MRSKPTIIFLLFLSFNLFFSRALPCTTFVIHQKGEIIFGRNLDWITGSGLMIVNPRNVKKTALVDPSENPVSWTSKYGSITFNQVGRDLPYGGMNEAGLVVESMTLGSTKYPAKDKRFAINANQWIQFQLDNYSTVKEVINSNKLLRIEDATSKYHYMVCDRYENVATIEFIDGKMVYHTRKSLPVPVLANSIYDNSLNCYQTHGKTDKNRSLYNFCTAVKELKAIHASSGDSLIDNAFNILHSVSQGYGTKWSIVYDITHMKIYFKVFETPTIVGKQKIFTKPVGQATIKFVDLEHFNFNCAKGAVVFNLNKNVSGNVDNQFVPYTTQINKEYITKAFKFFKDWGIGINISPKQIDALSKYPGSFQCVRK